MAFHNAARATLLLLSTTAVAMDYDVSVPGVGPLVGAPSHLNGVATFVGIPYAKPPMGDLRWQPPKPHDPWTAPRSAKEFGRPCVQANSHEAKLSECSEDCLFLNVYTPNRALKLAEKKLPVMVWLHGGAYQFGRGDEYEGDRLVVSSNFTVVVVTLNYRLNIFGFACGGEIKGRTMDGSCGNFGMQDQNFAMDWVSKHIGAFGGDGSDVTIFGTSSGGNSVFNHLVLTASFPLYKKAIIQSGVYSTGAVTMQAASKNYASLLQATSCKNLDCLLTLNGTEIANKMPVLKGSQGPVIDGVWLSATPADLVSEGKHNKRVPVIIGSNRDEDGSSWFDRTPHNMTEAEFDRSIGDKYGLENLHEIKQLYDPSVYPYPKDLGNYSRWWWTTIRITTDGVPSLGPCAARWLAKLLLKGGSSSIYTYLFAHPEQKNTPGYDSGPGTVIVPHAIEIQYVFNTAETINKGDEEELAAKMSKYWVNFAAAGDPNDAELPKWPKYARDSDMNIRFDVGADGIRPEEHLRKAACDYWEARLDTGADRSTETVIM